MAMDFSQPLLQKSLKTNFKIHLSFSAFCQFSRSLFQALRYRGGGGGGGHLGIFWVYMCRTGLQIGSPFKKKFSPKIDTPF